jgi:hypothetical protein
MGNCEVIKVEAKVWSYGKELTNGRHILNSGGEMKL